MERLKKDFYNIRFAIIPILIFIVTMQTMFGTVCTLKAFTGISCPCCGLTHATVYLFMGRWRDSWNANPTAILWIVAIILFIVDRYIHKFKAKLFPNVFFIVATITVIWYIFKMINIFN